MSSITPYCEKHHISESDIDKIQMKEFLPIIFISYSCQVCGREIPGNLNDNFSTWPLCSDECRLLNIGRILRTYTNSQIQDMLSIALPSYRPDKRINAINKLAVWILNKMNEVRG